MTNDASCTREIKSSFAKANVAFNKKNNFHQQIGLTHEISEVLYLELRILLC